MQRIRVSHLRPGQRYDTPIFSAWGQKLLSAGVELTERHITALRRSSTSQIILARDVAELEREGVVRPLETGRLRRGDRFKGNLVTRAGQVLLEAGEEIEPHHLDAARASGGVYEVEVQPAEPSHTARDRLVTAEAIQAELEKKTQGLDLRVASHGPGYWKPVSPEKPWLAVDELEAFRAAHVATIRRLYARVEAGLSAPIECLDPIIHDLLDLVRQHPNHFSQLALLLRHPDDYVPDHVYTVTVLAMATAMGLQWSRGRLEELAQAALLYDVGMLNVPARIREGGGELSEDDRERIRKHPLFSVHLLESVRVTPPLILLAASQHHEREDGSGYPRGDGGQRLCDHARVLAAVDTFAAATQRRGYREAKLPHTAMKELLQAAKEGAIWKDAARALVQAVGLFPIGSHVELSDGRAARVLAANPAACDRPVVKPLNDQSIRGDTIDLADRKHQHLRIVSAVAA